MDKVIEAFGINWMSMVYYLVNFLILFFLLYKIGYKAILKFVNERTAEIEKGLTDAKEAALALQHAQQAQEDILAAARVDASQLLEEARKRGDEHLAEVKGQAQVEIEKMVEAGKASMQADRDKMMHEIREEAVALVLQATEKVLQKNMDAETDKKFVESVLSK